MEDAGFAGRLRIRRAAAGLSQRDLARASGVKQPLIAAIETSTRQPSEAVRRALEDAIQVRPSQLLQLSRERVLAAVHAIGGDVRVFGSVARRQDRPDSDVDLLVSFPSGADIITLLALEEELSDLLTVPVDIVSTGSSGPVLARALAEAVPL